MSLFIIYIVCIGLALLLNKADLSQAILGVAYYVPIVFCLFLGLTGVTEGGRCSLFGSCIATPVGWLFIALFWFIIVWLLAWVLSVFMRNIKEARSIQ